MEMPLMCLNSANTPFLCFVFMSILISTTITGLSGDQFHFDVNGDGPARYNIIHFKQSSTGVYGWVKVGEYYEGELRLNMDGTFEGVDGMRIIWVPVINGNNIYLFA